MPGEPRVLIIDDDSFVTRVLTTRLRSEGYQIRSAVDAQAGQIVAGGWQPDVVVLDDQTDGSGGLNALQTLRAQPSTREIPIILLSSQVGGNPDDQAIDWGATAVVPKPYDSRTLLRAVAEAIPSRACR